jgi:hypothetical protein
MAGITDNIIKGKLRVTTHGPRKYQIHDNAAEEASP